MDKYIPITYENKKSAKEKFNPKKLSKVASFGFNTQIGYITNISTALYELQSKFGKDSLEWNEIETRLKLCRKAQGMEIDRAKNGNKFQPFPKNWTNYHRITEEDLQNLSDDEIKKIEFDNKLVINAERPYFMRYVYSKKNREYRDFRADFNRLSRIYWGCNIEKISDIDKKTDLYQEFQTYYSRKNPLMETNGTMNKICKYMENQVSEFKQTQRYKNDKKMFEILFQGENIEDFDNQLLKMHQKYAKYNVFKANKGVNDSEFNTYEQFYKSLRQECLDEINNNEQELARLAVYLCYQVYSCKPKDFAWDCFGGGILKNLLKNKQEIWLPLKNQYGDIDYLNTKYTNGFISFDNGEIDVDKTMSLDFDLTLNDDILGGEDLNLDDNIFNFDL